MEQINFELVNDLAEGDNDFMREIVTLYIAQFQELSTSIPDAIDSGSIEEFRFEFHKYYASVETLQLRNLKHKLIEARTLLESNQKDDGSLKREIKKLCLETAALLQEKLKEFV